MKVEIREVSGMIEVYKGTIYLKFPKTLQFTDTDLWISIEGRKCVIGLSDFQAELLGDITEISLPLEEQIVEPDLEIGVIEGSRDIFGIISPIRGQILARNPLVLSKPYLTNTDPYGEGWLLKMDGRVETKILTTREYVKLVEERLLREKKPL
ncbi:MAG: glycine cleavage system protein H [Candidatus Hodarchaeota archaeon]